MFVLGGFVFSGGLHFVERTVNNVMWISAFQMSCLRVVILLSSYGLFGLSDL